MEVQNSKFLKLMEGSSTPIIGDGAMGTLLNSRGVSFTTCFDALNLTNPGLIQEIHHAYIAAGSQVIQTNTFGANRYKLAQHGLEDQLQEINQAGVELARRVVQESGSEALVAGDVGPLGVRLAPFGRVQTDQACLIFAEQIQTLCSAGADLIVIETISDLVEMRAAITAARQVCDLPVVASLSFTRDDRTLLGETSAQAARSLFEAKADVIGVNCSGGPEQIYRILRQMHAAVPQARLSAMPNAGWPEQVGGRIMYPASPNYFGEYARLFRESGAILIGGCCGTTPNHITAMKAAIESGVVTDQYNGIRITVSESEVLPDKDEPGSKLAGNLAAGKFVVSIEMDPPRGLSTHKLLAGASLLAEAGADVINVADSPMARMRMSPWAVCNLIQRELNLETTLHFPTRGRNLLRVQGDLLAAHALGIRNVFVVMGDPTEIGDYPDAADNYDLVPSGLIRLIKGSFNAGMDHAGTKIGQPTAFFVGCALNLTPKDTEREIRGLKRKLQAGADFILTQPVYNPETASAFLEKYAEFNGPVDVPLLVGVLPLVGARHATFLQNEVPGIDIPEKIIDRLRQAGEDAPNVGVEIALELITIMHAWTSGIYLMPAFNRYDLAAEIVEETRRI